MSPPDADGVADLIRRLEQAVGAPGADAATVAAAVAAGEVVDDGAPLGARADPGVDGVEVVSVTRRADGDEPNAAEIRLAAGLMLADLEERLGPSRPMKRRKPGDRRVMFQGDGAATTIASVDAGGRVGVITVRREG